MMKIWMAPAGLHIEPGQPRDAEALAKLHAQGFYRGWPTSDFATYLSDPDAPTFIACDAKRKIAGFALLRLAADEVELMTIAVDPKWRHKGIGRALLDAVFADLMLTPARRIFLEVAADNGPAIKLYERFGFKKLSERPAYYPRPDGRPATAIVMGRDLG